MEKTVFVVGLLLWTVFLLAAPAVCNWTERNPPGWRARQSSVLQPLNAVASLAIDGNTVTRFLSDLGAPQCTSTNATDRPWWALDVGESAVFRGFELYNRQEGSDQLRNFEIRVGNVEPLNLASIRLNALCMRQVGPAPPGVFDVLCDAAVNSGRRVGQYVTLQLLGSSTVLSLCEFRPIFDGSRDVTAWSPMNPLGWRARQSSIGNPTFLPNFFPRAYLAIDGVRATTLSTEAGWAQCMQTFEFTSQPWWGLDLGKTAVITGFYIYNVASEPGRLIRNFQIRVGFLEPQDGVSVQQNALCSSNPLAAPAGKFYVSCQSVMYGQYVTLQILDLAAVLAMCEFEPEFALQCLEREGGNPCRPCADFEWSDLGTNICQPTGNTVETLADPTARALVEKLVNPLHFSVIGTPLFRGDPAAAGSFNFTNSRLTQTGLQQGLVISTGLAKSSALFRLSRLPGQLKDPVLTFDNQGYEGDVDLDTRFAEGSSDCGALEFQLKAKTRGALNLKYVLASEEFATPYEDGFGIYISQNGGPFVNVATQPGPTGQVEAVTIPSLREGSQASFFVYNNDGTGGSNNTFPYAGYTRRLSSQFVLVAPNDTVAVKVVICDLGDSTADSALFLQANSLGLCFPGSISDGTDCVPCPINTFSGDPTAKACTPCPKGTVAPNPGSTSCGVRCNAGFGQSFSGAPCTICLLGTFSAGGVNATCTPCPPGQTTRTPGAQTLAACGFQCPPGQEPQGGACGLCLVGTYSPGGFNAPCIRCPHLQITDGRGATSLDACGPGCEAGFELKNGTCMPCAPNTFSRAGVLVSCSPCPANTSTNGKEGAAACAPTCASGQGVEPGGGVCVSCPVGQFSAGGFNASCTPCGNSRTTLATGSTDVSACVCRNITGYRLVSKVAPDQVFPYRSAAASDLSLLARVCTNYTACIGFVTSGGFVTDARALREVFTDSCDGLFVKDTVICGSGQGLTPSRSFCFTCPVGTYSDGGVPSYCGPCPEGETTKANGSTSISMCGPICQPGQGLNSTGTGCVACPIDFFSRGGGFGEPCQRCPVGETTFGLTGSRTCLKMGGDIPGYVFYPQTLSRAVAYDWPRQDPANLVALRETCSETYAEECIAFNTFGFFHRDLVDFAFTPWAEGAGTYVRSVGICLPGSGVIDGKCVGCPVGTYSPGGVWPECQPCLNQGTTTRKFNATSESDCVCPKVPGYDFFPLLLPQVTFWPEGDGTNLLELAAECSNDVSCVAVAFGSGGGLLATDVSIMTPVFKRDCDGTHVKSIAVCAPGRGWNGGRCVVCGNGTYSGGGPLASCLPCPPGLTTDREGATSRDQCGYLCPPNFGISNSSPPECVPCPLEQFSSGGINPTCTELLRRGSSFSKN